MIKYYYCFLMLILCSICNNTNAATNIGTKSPQITIPLTVNGTVTDSQDESLIGVNILIKGTNQGATTDINGNYIIKNVNANDTLVFTYIGYAILEVPVNNQTEINVVMDESAQQVEELVVVAFAKQKKEDVIGSVTNINPKELKVPASNLTNALAGRISGLVSYQRSGEPGLGKDNAEFFIRGVTTFGYKKDPLILIDGVEFSTRDLAALNTDDIESFNIMKDATATSLYGARGANGVILITTKTGVESKPSLSFRIENSMSTNTKTVDLADPITYMRLYNDAVVSRDPLGAKPFSKEKIDRTASGENPLVYPAIDWKNILLKDQTINHRANMNLRGGGRIAQYYISGSFSQDNGILNVPQVSNFNNNIDFKNYNIRSNVSINLTEDMKLGVKAYGRFDDYNGPVNGGEATFNQIMYTSPVRFQPFYAPTDDFKYVNHILFGNDGNANYVNPYAELVRGYRENRESVIMLQAEFSANLSKYVDGLDLFVMGNSNRTSEAGITRAYNPFYYNISSYDRLTGDYSLELINEDDGTEYLNFNPEQTTVANNLYLQGQFNYNKTFADKHGVSGLLLGYLRSIQTFRETGSLQQTLPFRNLGAAGRFTYNYDRKYFAELNFGLNGSERFSKSERFGFFPSFGLSWVISNENFWEPLKEKISNLKLRGTYGLTGNDDISSERFFFLSEVDINNGGNGFTFGNDFGYSRPGVQILRYPNPFITWETSLKTNVALEMELFNSISFIIEGWDETRTSILQSRQDIPSTLGLASNIQANIGEVSSRGFEVSMDGSKFYKNTFWIQGRANLTFATNQFDIYEELNYDEAYRSRIGKPVNQLFGYIAERLFIDDADVENNPFQGLDVRGGDIKFKDVNGDKVINDLDRVPIGHPTVPELTYGFGISTGYRNLDLSAFFQGSGRTSFYMNPNHTAPFINERALLQAFADDHWSETNQDLHALWPRLSPNNVENNNRLSTWFLRDGSFLRLKQIEVGYTFSKDWIERIGLKGARFYLNGSNLFLWSKFDLWDVEMGGQGLGYPLQKVYNLGLSINI